MVLKKRSTHTNLLVKWFLLITIFFFICVRCFALASDNENVSNSGVSESVSHKWIESDKIRAGYLYFSDPILKIKLVKDLGLNTIIVKCYRFEYDNFRQDTIDKMKEWAKTAKNNDIHLFFSINWQPYPRTGGLKYDSVVYEDGSKGVAVCPLDEKFWKEQIEDIFMLISAMSTEPSFQIDGIFFDMEIYGSEKEPQARRDYYEPKCCFCNRCFFKYLNYKGYKPDGFPTVESKERKAWLTDKKLLDDYFIFLRAHLQDKAEKLRDTVHKINPNLFIGMYPHPVEENFVQYPLAKGFSSQRLPFVVFGIHSYGYNVFLNGDACIPKDVKERYHKEAINALYVAGYLLGKYDGAALERNLKESLKNWDGYWLFNLQQLWKAEDNSDKFLRLKDSLENLEKAIIRSNDMKN